ncbi:MAG: pentapeptide repeat-containing protein [Planctomycetota bacterium]
MQDDIRASLDDLAFRWETPKGRELKEKVIKDARNNGGRGIVDLLKEFIYVREVPHGKDLRCITLDGQDLSDCTFGKVDMSWASLANATMTRCDLREASLKRASLTGANLSLARMDGSDCSRADFSEAVLDGAHFKEAKLTGAVFVQCDARRASFDSANAAKANFQGAQLDQANFFNADCNNTNFDSGALDRLAARPAKAWGVRWDLDRDVFEKEVGLKAITSRATKKFKGLEALLKTSLTPEPEKKEVEAGPDPDAMIFGASLRGTKKLEPVEEDPTDFQPRIGPDADPYERPTRTHRSTDAHRMPPPSDMGSGERRRPPPPPARRDTRSGVRRPTGAQPGGPGGPPPSGPLPGGRPTGGHPTGRPPSGPPPVGGRRTTARGPVAGPPPGAPPRPGPPSGAIRRGPPPSQKLEPPPPPPPPPLPISPFEEEGPEPANDWARAIGQLMQMKDSVSQIVIDLGDKSRIIFKKQ